MIFETHDSFSPYARDLRKHFDDRFRDPHVSLANRFVWDYWHIPNEYTFLRTPAFHYFPKRLYEKFHRHLVNWGRENLGCHDISPTWLSCYVEGCRQHWHRDEPHGPLAFVLSLTSEKKFKGGRTVIRKGSKPIVIEPDFNRLIVFDPSLRHGVDEVKNVLDPRKARLVLHGWFVNPRVFWKGRLTAAEVQEVIEGQLMPTLGRRDIQGYCGWRLSISSSGQVEDVRLLADTLQTNREKHIEYLFSRLRVLRFPPKKKSTLTLPLTFSTK